ncbi:MAG: TRAP transporter small permease subunit [Beijerinckiaceae bacterium]
MHRLENIAAAIFGTAFTFLAFAVAVETAMRKIFNKSLQGVDELGGYILAVGAALAMAAALVSRAHIRIDLLHDYAPRFLRNALNLIAVVALAVSAIFLARMAWIALDESRLFNATAQTPWATPLRYPQTIWVIALLLFVSVALIQCARAFWMAWRRDWNALDRTYGPRGAKDELDEELEDLKKRSGDTLPQVQP